MTNPLPPTTPPSPTGGMPKWVIILLVILLIIILGCCGGFITCGYVLKKTGESAKAALDNAPAWAAQAEARAAEMRAAAERQAAEQAAAGATGGAVAGGPTATDGGAPAGASPTAAAPESPTMAAKMPVNFPSDVPMFTGLTPVYSLADNTKGSGSVLLTGKIDKEKAVTFYEKELGKQGWKQEQNMDLAGSTVMMYSKEARKLNLTLSPDPSSGVTTVTLQYEGKPE